MDVMSAHFDNAPIQARFGDLIEQQIITEKEEEALQIAETRARGQMFGPMWDWPASRVRNTGR